MENEQKLFEQMIVEDESLVAAVQNAVPGAPMSPDEFAAWLDQQA